MQLDIKILKYLVLYVKTYNDMKCYAIEKAKL